MPTAAGQSGEGKEAGVLLASAPPASRAPKFGPVVPTRNADPGQDASNEGRPEDGSLQEPLAPAPSLSSQPAGVGGKSAETPAGKAEAPAKAAGAVKPSSEDIASVVSGQTEAWRKAWESGNLDAYVSFYASNARQGSRSSAEAIRTHKRALWSKAAPSSLTLENMRIDVRGDTATVVARQEYADSNDGGDRGIKTLIFKKLNGQWLITQEKWSPLSDEAGN